MITDTKITQAIKFGKKAHKGQLDDDGKDYFDHCMEVYRILSQITNDEDTLIAGLLHDVLEDTSLIYEQLASVFGLNVANLVLEVTHYGDKSTGYYFPNLHSKKAIMIKFADRLSNLNRMSSWKEDRQAHYLKKSKFWKSGVKDD